MMQRRRSSGASQEGATQGLALVGASQGPSQSQGPGPGLSFSQQLASQGNQSAAEIRRRVRQMYRTELEDLEVSRGDYAPTTEGVVALWGLLDKADEYYKHVIHAREGVMDSALFRQITAIAAEQAHRLNSGARQYNPSEYIESLATVVEKSGFGPLGGLMHSLTQVTPTATFMYGPIESQPKQRVNTRQARIRDKEVAQVVPDQVESIADQKSETTKRVDVIDGVLEKHPEGLEFLRLVYDPQDFGRTIENIFHCSFLIKDGQARFRDHNGMVFIDYCNPPTDEEVKSGQAVKKQCIVRFDYNDWLKLKDVLTGPALIPQVAEGDGQVQPSRRRASAAATHDTAAATTTTTTTSKAKKAAPKSRKRKRVQSDDEDSMELSDD